ncbi:hypothetical protein DOTSEDRAFT_72074 [Dothistroma septosporum NZE10]|uniref:Uncharacterized protein n=1 Tax=Dothistroma septosporum (strain NZE10 / CBS 128990) TaxID=675120 RepID=N1PNH8_DOTSN|nr:hypothetical protein DOTSEDRAFT_72074 [Dothistroma septosporum NZE10]
MVIGFNCFGRHTEDARRQDRYPGAAYWNDVDDAKHLYRREKQAGHAIRQEATRYMTVRAYSSTWRDLKLSILHGIAGARHCDLSPSVVTLTVREDEEMTARINISHQT